MLNDLTSVHARHQHVRRYHPGRVPGVRDRLAVLEPEDVAISAIVRAELYDGLMGLAPSHRLVAVTHDFLAGIRTLAWQGDFAEQFARARYRLRRQGNIIEDMDLLIAAHAISNGAMLVTHNTRHFERLVPDLMIENWVVPPS